MSACYRLDDPATLRAHLAHGMRIHDVSRPAGAGHAREGHNDSRAWRAPTSESSLPPKSFLFAERESLFVFDGERFRETAPIVEPCVLFGVSACDLAAIAYQDRFFADDPWYRARRAALLLVGSDCTVPCDGGFCPLTGSGPFVREAQADLVLHRDDHGWLLFVTSTAGASAIAGLAGVAAAEIPRADFIATREPAVIAQFPSDEPLRRGIAALNNGQADIGTWQRLGTECITCSGCTVSCPTCSCYATRQEAGDSPGNTSTVRFWDSCLYEGFQREASGHNPTAAAGSRIERYWTHKFGDAFVARFGHYTCTGCGRCDRVCPSGIGAKSVLRRLGESASRREGGSA